LALALYGRYHYSPSLQRSRAKLTGPGSRSHINFHRRKNFMRISEKSPDPSQMLLRSRALCQ
jgi:hypothetical protein